MVTTGLRLIDQAKQTLSAAQNAIALKREQEIAEHIQSTIANLKEIVLKAASEGKNDITLFKLTQDDYLHYSDSRTPSGYLFTSLYSKSLRDFCDFLIKEGFTITADDPGDGGRDLRININTPSFHHDSLKIQGEITEIPEATFELLKKLAPMNIAIRIVKLKDLNSIGKALS